MVFGFWGGSTLHEKPNIGNFDTHVSANIHFTNNYTIEGKNTRLPTDFKKNRGVSDVCGVL